jgi:hypothetical protein
MDRRMHAMLPSPRGCSADESAGPSILFALFRSRFVGIRLSKPTHCAAGSGISWSQERSEALRRGQSIGVDHAFFDLPPVDIGPIEPDPDPTAVPEIGRYKESIRLRHDQCGLLAQWGLEREGEPTVTVMILCEVSERLVPHQVGHVESLLATRTLRRLGKCGGAAVELSPAPSCTGECH